MKAESQGRNIIPWLQKTSRVKNSMTGTLLSGIGKHELPMDSLGRPLQDLEKGYNLRLNTFKQGTQTKSRTNSAYWLRGIHPVNYILINRITADELGFKSGEKVRITSLSNPEGIWDLGELGTKPVAGELKVIEGIRPGGITFSLGFGHWAYGSQDVEIDNEVLKGDPERGVGFHANAAMRIDPHLKNVSLQDLVGGSVSFYDSPIRLEKVTSHSKTNIELA